jgi:hypothetical protein
MAEVDNRGCQKAEESGLSLIGHGNHFYSKQESDTMEVVIYEEKQKICHMQGRRMREVDTRVYTKRGHNILDLEDRGHGKEEFVQENSNYFQFCHFHRQNQ